MILGAVESGRAISLHVRITVPRMTFMDAFRSTTALTERNHTAILDAQNVRRRSYPGPPEWSGIGAVPVGAGVVASDSVGCGASSAGSDRLVLEVLL